MRSSTVVRGVLVALATVPLTTANPIIVPGLEQTHAGEPTSNPTAVIPKEEPPQSKTDDSPTPPPTDEPEAPEIHVSFAALEEQEPKKAGNPEKKKSNLPPLGKTATIKPYETTCQDCGFYTKSPSYLECYCKDLKGEWTAASIDLNKCIANVGGVLVWRKDGGFGKSCGQRVREVTAEGHLHTYCSSGRESGGLWPSDFYLGTHLYNNNGALACNPPKYYDRK